MITTNENITDPVEFLKADPALAAGLEPGGAIAISGPDVDVSIKRLKYDAVRFGRVSEHTSRFLGNIYVQCAAYGEQVDGISYDLGWFPSPTAVNNLIESMGLRPGEDVMRFTHSEGAEISAKRYFKHITDKEYPQSTDAGSFTFAHDRNRDHAIGVLLMPKAMTDVIVETAKRGGMHSKYTFTKTSGMAESFDRTTGTLGKIADQELWPRLANQEEDAVEKVANDTTWSNFISAPKLWPTHERGAKKRRLDRIKMLSDHLLELHPKVVELQSELNSNSEAVAL